jgi:CheY-like chemotaxis protein
MVLKAGLARFLLKYSCSGLSRFGGVDWNVDRLIGAVRTVLSEGAMSPNALGSVLVVDDDRTIRTLLRKMLERIGFTSIYEAINGHHAIQVMGSMSVDYLITDLRMPGMTGLQLLDSEIVLKNTGLKKRILMSATLWDIAPEDIRRLNIDHCIAKPFDMAAFEKLFESRPSRSSTQAVFSQAAVKG